MIAESDAHVRRIAGKLILKVFPKYLQNRGKKTFGMHRWGVRLAKLCIYGAK